MEGVQLTCLAADHYTKKSAGGQHLGGGNAGDPTREHKSKETLSS